MFAGVAPLVQTRVVTLADAAPMVDFLMRDAPAIDTRFVAEGDAPTVVAQRARRDGGGVRPHPVGRRLAQAVLEDIGTRHDVKLGKAQAPVRVAVTGRTVGPPLFESLEVLGREATIERLDAAVGRLSRTG